MKSSTQSESAPAPNAAGAPTSDPSDPDNAFFDAEWTTPYGAPPFGRIDEADYAPAFEAAMKRHSAEIAAIAAETEPPTFENTVGALERSGEMLQRVAGVFFNLASTDGNPQMQKLRSEYAPKLSTHSDQVYQNARLWARIEQVSEEGLSPEQKKVLADYRRDFVNRGARLDPDEKARLSAINAKLAGLYSEFSDRIRQENADYALVIEDEAKLAGLPPEVRAQAAAEAKSRKMQGKWAFTLVRSSITPFLQYADDRGLREEIYRAYTERGAHDDAKNTDALIQEITALRAERAQLLGFATHAHFQTSKNMAQTPEAVRGLLDQLWAGALAKAKAERKLLQAEMAKSLPGAPLKPWDWWYYAKKLRKAKYDLKQEALKPYFQVDTVREGAFSVASRLFGITFEEITANVPVYHPEVKVFDVKDQSGGHVGVLYVDYHPRPSKRGGAWMNVFREQHKLDGDVRPLVVNVGNFPSPAGDKPALLGWDEVRTLFHEFGHALHGLLSDVRYPRVAGTSVKRDYVEFPSQLLENWASEPSVMKRYARHYETGEPIPDALIEKIRKASTFNQGFQMTELVAAALLDMEWHTMDAQATAAAAQDPRKFDRAVMKKLGAIPEIEPRYHSNYFQHIFASDGYSAGYYVYLWAQVLEADAYAAFEAKDDPFDPELADRLRTFVFAAGGSDDEMTLYRKFRGRAPTVDALLDAKGLR